MSEQLAKRFHEAYERLAPQFGYSTRKESAVPWEQVPENNRRLMIAVCDELEAAATQQGAQAIPFDNARLGQIAVNAPGCDRCGKMFLDCQCDREPSVTAASEPSDAVQLATYLRAVPSPQWDYDEIQKRAQRVISTATHRPVQEQELLDEADLKEILSHCIYDPIDMPLAVKKLNAKLANRRERKGEA